MSKKSSYNREIPESCRWWDAIFQVIVNGLTRGTRKVNGNKVGVHGNSNRYDESI